MKVGIPRSLYYYYFKDFWVCFFKYLNIEVIVSPKTNKNIFNIGIKYSTDEMCLSLKNYIGHVFYLKDKCNYILIPRIDNYGRNNQTCTNFLASYDIINNIDDINILNYNINLLKQETLLKALINIGKILSINKKDIKDAYIYAKAKSSIAKKQKILENMKKLKSNKIKILLLGHPYNIYDEMIGMPIIYILKKMNIEIIYSDLFFDLNDKCNYSKEIYWRFSRENINSIDKCKKSIDGIIFISSFPCGLDSLVNELVMRKLLIPYLNLIIDDIESSGGIETRIESFIDIIKAKINN